MPRALSMHFGEFTFFWLVGKLIYREQIKLMLAKNMQLSVRHLHELFQMPLSEKAFAELAHLE